MDQRQTTAVLVVIAAIVLFVAASKIGTSRKFQIGAEGFLGLTLKGNRFGIGGQGTADIGNDWRPRSFTGTYEIIRPSRPNFSEGSMGETKTHTGEFNFYRK